MVQVKKSILDNKILLKLILFIAKEEPTNSYRLANVLEKSQSIIYKQMIMLQNENYLILSDSLYSLNYSKIATEFELYLEETRPLELALFKKFCTDVFWRDFLKTDKGSNIVDRSTLRDLFIGLGMAISFAHANANYLSN